MRPIDPKAQRAWEIWQFATPDREKIEHVFRYQSDEKAAKKRFEEIERGIRVTGGTYELRNNGEYLVSISCSPPEVKP